jgi:tRNA A-37 threonylcarbamoyl transferase component Bud32
MMFNGNSGCDLKLVGDGIIRKTSMSFDYNPRLKAQIQKQMSFTHDEIKTPKILSDGSIDGFDYYDMEFINGQKFSDMLTDAPFEFTIVMFKRLMSFIDENTTEVMINPHDQILKKLKSIDELVGVDISIKNYVIKNSNIEIPCGYTHGDYTFENIIVFDGDIYFIDFLDGYLSSPLVDISKLYQELHLNWSNRGKNIPFLTNVRNHELKKILDDFIKYKGYDITAVRVQIVMTLLRTLPYIKNTDTYYKVLNKIFQIINL